jgi:fatty acid desaturase
MLDPRNSDYLPWLLVCSVLPPVLLWFAWQRHRVHGFELTTMLVYHHFRIGPRFRFFAHHHVLVHKEGHNWNGIFAGKWRIMNQLAGMWTGLFYGTIPFHYRTAHNKIHHRWHNDSDDVHTNIDVDRTVFKSYILWLPRFFYYWTGVSPMVLFLKRREYGLAKDLATGMLYYYGIGVALCVVVDWKFALAYWLYPNMESLSLLGMIAYIWHAFVEPEDPTNQYVNSVTILNGGDNIWNEDYHVVHHHYPNVHWSQAVEHYEKQQHKYAEVNATIFQDCEEGMLIYWMFSGLWDEMANHFVDLNGKLSHNEKKELILRRLRFRKTFEDWRTVSAMWAKWGSSFQRNWDDGKND